MIISSILGKLYPCNINDVTFNDPAVFKIHEYIFGRYKVII